ncbi:MULTISPECIES: MazG nucleotide pyrophosphohydrolase domain-containing protein [Vibrio]|uniref:MazG nucleotide pyrophosphohydrolase domain-containing protein n=1 Tax=Vibrio TaxID=662 RepID=UPI001123CA76|nr:MULTISPECIES: MazG nucleotide pyrophosphohydrolase domain-containing protein [Vibrio]EHQ9271120.1 nucleotide pyrophosphohydrolase [Vibrio parahaemolyticus]EKB7281805.1 nucleotide pyrophosphohydrolase [Vibrio parahaemolyticus]MBE4381411.1 nucleotide pyrophosphohydrolase [Vibrio parahaemolyticus]MCX8799676.1 nucleotide pyrophosphohydrolase [Vibrio parahaemolyticus]MDS1787195.1 MazG nucleotide pyrophosphohydrolase domain-containing protein [Vibrio parahaemolyticus]
MESKSGRLLGELQKIAALKSQRDLKGSWFKGSSTYLDALVEEISEVKEELVSGRQCFLEDELGDLLWDFVCLIEHLELEGKVDKERVFQRSVDKYAERVTNRSPGETWDDVKLRQKLELKKECDSTS